MAENIQDDKYEQDLQDRKEILQKCQEERQINTCFKCEEILTCKTRDQYVLSVYNSMSKGENTDFEF